jgi:hypothetical protein
METARHADRDFALSGDHVVEWQLVGATDSREYEAEGRDVRERLLALEAQAMTLLRAAVTNPGAAAARRSLAALDAEILSLRAEIAWRRAAVRAA